MILDTTKQYTITTKWDGKNRMMHIDTKNTTWPWYFDKQYTTERYDIQIFDNKVSPYTAIKRWEARCLVCGKREMIQPTDLSWRLDAEYTNHSI